MWNAKGGKMSEALLECSFQAYHTYKTIGGLFLIHSEDALQMWQSPEDKRSRTNKKTGNACSAAAVELRQSAL